MKVEILNRIQELGGTFKKGNSIREVIEGIEFSHPLYPHELWGNELYGIDEFFDENQVLYKKDKDEFYNSLVAHFFSDHEIPYGQTFYRKRYFTPLTKGSDDYKEWGDIFEDKEMTDLSLIRGVIGNGTLEFMEIAYSYGCPDHYYVCLSDPNPENPVVFGTDHEVYFLEISNEGTFEEFLKQFYSKNEFIELVRTYIESERN